MVPVDGLALCLCLFFICVRMMKEEGCGAEVYRLEKKLIHPKNLETTVIPRVT